METTLDTHGMTVDLESLEDLVGKLNELEKMKQAFRKMHDLKADEVHVQAFYNLSDGFIYSFTVLCGYYPDLVADDSDMVPIGEWEKPVSRQEILDAIAFNVGIQANERGRIEMITQLNVKVDSEVKAQAERVCSNIGLTLSAAINIYLRKLGKEKRIPFALTADADENEEE